MNLAVNFRSLNRRIKILSTLIIIVTVFSASLTRADRDSSGPVSSVDVEWQKLKSAQIEIQAFASGQGEVLSSYPTFLQDLMRGIWGWKPEKQLKKSPTTTAEKIIERIPESYLQEVMQNLAIDFDLSDPTHFRKVWFHLKPGLKVRGLFGIHDFQKKRPLVIIRMGIHGNVDEVLSERFLAGVVYEDLDANFLILESLTSYAFVSENNEISIGGIDEGLQTFLILNELANPQSPFAKLISQVHLLGLSMGGQGTFVTALLDQQNGRKIKSILNFCPLINLEKTFLAHSSSGLRPALIDLWNARRMNTLFDRYPKEIESSQWWKTLLDLKPRFTPVMLDILNQNRRQPLISVEEIESQVSGMKWPKGFAEHLNNSKTFYDLNNFWPLYQGVKTPISLIATPHDPLVINEFNSELIMSKKQPGDFTSVKYEIYDRGIHCGFGPVYQWDYIVDIVKKGLGI